jgi:nitrogenase subunit NifH
VRLAEAPSYGKPVIAFDRSSKGAQAYLLLAQEILDRRADRRARGAQPRDWESTAMKLKGLGPRSRCFAGR